MEVLHLKVDFCLVLYRSTYHELMVLFMCLRFYSIVILILTQSFIGEIYCSVGFYFGELLGSGRIIKG